MQHYKSWALNFSYSTSDGGLTRGERRVFGKETGNLRNRFCIQLKPEKVLLSIRIERNMVGAWRENIAGKTRI